MVQLDLKQHGTTDFIAWQRAKRSVYSVRIIRLRYHTHMVSESPIHPVHLTDEQLLKQCRISRGRRSGPGGQHRNKVETAVRLVHRSTGIHVGATERRSQKENLNAAVFRLRVMLALKIRGYRNRNLKSFPSGLWRSRVQTQRIACNNQHRDFPVLLAEALDTIAACGFDHHRAAAVLALSPSQFIKFLKKEPLALEWVNKHRCDAGSQPLR